MNKLHVLVLQKKSEIKEKDVIKKLEQKDYAEDGRKLRRNSVDGSGKLPYISSFLLLFYFDNDVICESM